MNSREHICESFELFANEFMPEFQDAEAEQQEWKTKVLAASRPGLKKVDTSPFESRFSKNLGAAGAGGGRGCRGRLGAAMPLGS